MDETKIRRRSGDRKDGRLIRSLPGFGNFIPFIMKDRNDALVQYEESIEISVVDKWLRAQRVNGYKGMGIGLSICKTIIRAHGGQIEAKNLEEGAEFVFRLPAYIEEIGNESEDIGFSD